MSEERRKRKEERENPGKVMSGLKRKLVVALVIAAAIGAIYYVGMRKRTSRLDAFAQCLAAKQVKMYGLFWCTHCAEQKELFGSSFQYVPYVECGIKGSRDEAPSCLTAGVKNFPAWQFMDERREGLMSLSALSEKTGCTLP